MHPSNLAQMHMGRPRHIPPPSMPMRPMRPFRKIEILPYIRPTRPLKQNGNGPNSNNNENLKFEAHLPKNDKEYRAPNSDTLPDTSNLEDDTNTQMQPDEKSKQQFHVSDDNDKVFPVKMTKLSEVPKMSENVVIEKPIVTKSLGLFVNCSTGSDEYVLPEEVSTVKLNISTDSIENNLSKNSNASEEVTQPKSSNNDPEYSNDRLRSFYTMPERAIHLKKFIYEF